MNRIPDPAHGRRQFKLAKAYSKAAVALVVDASDAASRQETAELLRLAASAELKMSAALTAAAEFDSIRWRPVLLLASRVGVAASFRLEKTARAIEAEEAA